MTPRRQEIRIQTSKSYRQDRQAKTVINRHDAKAPGNPEQISAMPVEPQNAQFLMQK
jgi:hypothetical protein